MRKDRVKGRRRRRRLRDGYGFVDLDLFIATALGGGIFAGLGLLKNVGFLWSGASLASNYLFINGGIRCHRDRQARLLVDYLYHLSHKSAFTLIGPKVRYSWKVGLVDSIYSPMIYMLIYPTYSDIINRG